MFLVHVGKKTVKLQDTYERNPVVVKAIREQTPSVSRHRKSRSGNKTPKLPEDEVKNCAEAHHDKQNKKSRNNNHRYVDFRRK